MAGGYIGEADIVIGADASGLDAAVVKQAKSELAKAGAQLGDTLAASMQKAVQAAASKIPAPITSAVAAVRDSVQKTASAVQSSLSSAAQKAGAQLTKIGTSARDAFNSAIKGAQSLPGPLGAFANAAVDASRRAREGIRDFAAGWVDARAGLSSFTGTLGTLGTAARAASTLAIYAIRGIGDAVATVASGIGTAFTAAWNLVSKGATAAARVVGEALKTTIGAAARGTAAIITGSLLTALTKGFTRLSGINQATARLEGLGLAGEATAKIMAGVDKAVTGTAFGMADAAQAAGLLATSGVKAGDQMDNALKAVVTTAAAAGSELSDIAPIFQTIAARGSVAGDELYQLLQRGVNASGALQKALGKNADEIAKMARNGEIGFDTFVAAIQDDLGLLAATMGGTLQGMVSNVGAQMGRIGAELQRPVFNALLHAMPGILQGFRNISAAVTEFMAPLENRLVPVAERLGAAFQSVTSGLSSDGIGSFVAALAPLAPLLGAILGSSAGLLSNIPIIGNLLAGLNGPIGAVIASLIAMMTVDPSTFEKGISSVLSYISKEMPKILTTVVNAVMNGLMNLAQNLPQMLDGIMKAFPRVFNQLALIMPDLILGLVAALTSGIAGMVNVFIEQLPRFIDSGIQLIMALLNGLIQALPMIVSIIPMLIDAGVQLVLALVTGLVEALPELITALVDGLISLVDSVTAMLPTLIEAGLELFLGLLTALIEAFPEIVLALVDALPRLITSLMNFLPKLIMAALELFLGIITGLMDALPDIISAVIDMMPKIVQSIIDAMPQFIEAGKDLVWGIIEGLGNMAGELWNAAVRLAKNAVSAFTNFLGISSPSKLFMGFGEDTMAGFIKGVESMAGAAAEAVKDAAPDVPDPEITLGGGRPGEFSAPPPPRPPGPGAGFGGGAGAASGTAGIGDGSGMTLMVVDVNGALIAAIQGPVYQAMNPGTPGNISSELGIV